LIICTKIKHEVYLEGIIIQLIIKQLIIKYFIYMISIKKIMSVIAIAFAVMTIAGSGVYSLAQSKVPPSSGVIADPCTGKTGLPGCDAGSGFGKIFNFTGTDAQSSLQSLISSVAGVLISLIAAVSVIYLILGAYKMISDSGDGKGFSAGKDNVKYAIIGLVVALLSFFIVSTIVRFVK
jgi:Type IV secretion system pilin